jgi:hypothetical protein
VLEAIDGSGSAADSDHTATDLVDMQEKGGGRSRRQRVGAPYKQEVAGSSPAPPIRPASFSHGQLGYLRCMTIAAAIFLIAVGAILRYATNWHVEGVSLDTVGLILMIAGVAGLVLSFFQEAIWSRRARRDEVVVDDRRDVPPRY